MKFIYILILISITAVSCQDVIELEISPKDAKLVVDGWLDNDSFPKIKLYKSVPYFKDGVYPVVSNATVTLNDGSSTFVLTESSPGNGFYTSNLVKGVKGKTYTLYIKFENKEYTSVATLPDSKLAFDSVYFRDFPFGRPGGPPRFFTMFAYQENPTPGNYYMARAAKNDTMELTDINFADDKYTNGNHITDVIAGTLVKPGDRVHLEGYEITQEYYSYLFQIVNNVYRQQGLFSPPIAPYKGNISNDGLGFFRVSYLVTKDTIVP